MVEQHYRWDFIGLSTDTKPTPEDSEKVVNGSTFYCSDTSKLYVFCKDTWYEKVVSGGGGGTSDFDQLSNRPKYNGVTMSSTTDIPEVKTYSDFVGTDGTATGTAGLVPAPATTDAGKFLNADGVWESVEDVNDYAIKGAGAPTTATQGTVGMIYEDTTNGELYQCTAVTPGTDPDPDTYTWSVVPRGVRIVTISQTDYDNLGTYDPNTLYVITGA